MDHSVAVCANKSKFIYMSLMSIGKSRDRFRVMTFDKSIAALTERMGRD